MAQGLRGPHPRFRPLPRPPLAIRGSGPAAAGCAVASASARPGARTSMPPALAARVTVWPLCIRSAADRASAVTAVPSGSGRRVSRPSRSSMRVTKGEARPGDHAFLRDHIGGQQRFAARQRRAAAPAPSSSRRISTGTFTDQVAPLAQPTRTSTRPVSRAARWRGFRAAAAGRQAQARIERRGREFDAGTLPASSRAQGAFGRGADGRERLQAPGHPARRPAARRWQQDGDQRCSRGSND